MSSRPPPARSDSRISAWKRLIFLDAASGTRVAQPRRMNNAVRALLVTVAFLSLTPFAKAQECVNDVEPGLAAVSVAVHGWQKYDSDAVMSADGSVDHRATASENFRTAKRDLYE